LISMLGFCRSWFRRAEEVCDSGNKIEGKDGAPDEAGQESNEVRGVPEADEISERVEDDGEGEENENPCWRQLETEESPEPGVKSDADQASEINAQAARANSQGVSEDKKASVWSLMADWRKDCIKEPLPRRGPALQVRSEDDRSEPQDKGRRREKIDGQNSAFRTEGAHLFFRRTRAQAPVMHDL